MLQNILITNLRLKSMAYTSRLTFVAVSVLLMPYFAQAQTFDGKASSTIQKLPAQLSCATTAEKTAQAILRSTITSHMSFLAFRKTVLAQGWVPIPHNPPCLDQIDTALCGMLPEISNTSSGPTEYNEMSYRHLQSGARLNVVVTGDITTWNTKNAGAELIVEGWDFNDVDPSN
jgi:hypothetical protein